LVPGTTRRTAETPTFISVRKAAEALGLSTATIYGLLSREELAAIRIGGSLRILATDLRAFVSSRRTTR
jgi:excisionase family DNA binding protein